MKMRMSNLNWKFTKENMKELCPELKPEERAEAVENLSQYFRIGGRTYDRLDDEGRIKDTLLRVQYEKRNRENNASRNVNRENDDTPYPNGNRTNPPSSCVTAVIIDFRIFRSQP